MLGPSIFVRVARSMMTCLCLFVEFVRTLSYKITEIPQFSEVFYFVENSDSCYISLIVT